MDSDLWRVITAHSQGDWAEWAARLFFDAGTTAIRERGVFRVVVPGGPIPRPAYERISRLCRCGSTPLYEACEEVFFPCGLSWDKVHLYFMEEHCVPPDAPTSCYRMVRESLVDKVPLPAGQVHRIEGEIEPTKSAERYNEHLTSWMDPEKPEGERFDLVVVGLGEEYDSLADTLEPRFGHVAHPYVGVLKDTGPLESTTLGEVARIKLTAKALRRTRAISFWVRGAMAKAAVQQGIEAQDGRSNLLSWLPAETHVTWVLDDGKMSSGEQIE